MDCTVARIWLFRKIDDELSSSENKLLDSHLALCSACMREFRILELPRRIGQAIPAFEPSSYFYRKLRARIESETQSITIWQIILGLSRQVVPALAAITLALLSIFAYLQLEGARLDVQAYDRVLLSGDRSLSIPADDQGEITDESVLRAIAEQDSTHRPSADAPESR
jgi:predicted anti-sigma-YlaC factor YlaD